MCWGYSTSHVSGIGNNHKREDYEGDWILFIALGTPDKATLSPLPL